MTTTFAIIVPTLNAGPVWERFLDSLTIQTQQPARRVLVDSGSTDRTVALAKAAGFEIHRIRRNQFDHGGTRQMIAIKVDDAPVLVYLTQDAVLADATALSRLVRPFLDPRLAVTYGRQLPRPGADAVEAHARLYNYPAESETRSQADIPRLGIKAAFCSNSFAAYRRDALMDVGGFPSKQIMIEDSIIAARALLQGWTVSYIADAMVYHSHHYTITQEFTRYFDIGVAHARNRRLFSQFGRTGGEGLRFVKSEMNYLIRNKPVAIPSSLLRTIFKYSGYQFGRAERWIPYPLRRKLSLHKHFWLKH